MGLLDAYQLVSTVLPIIAFLITAFRLWIRFKWDMLWWDDAVAAGTAVMILFYIPTIWLSTDPQRYHLSEIQAVIFFYLCAYAWEISVYGARLTMLVAILRIAPTPRIKILIKWCIAFFVAVLVVLLAQFLWVCEGQDPSWKTEPAPNCDLGLQIAVTELVTDIVCDALLVVIPLWFLSRSSLKKSQKYRLYGIFTAGVFTTIVSIVQDILVLRIGGFAPAVAGAVMVGVSSMVSNIPVLVPVVRRMLGYETASGAGTSYNHQSQSPRGQRTTIGGKHHHRSTGSRAHTIELGDLSTPSNRSFERYEAKTNWTADARTESDYPDYKFEVEADITGGPGPHDTYRHPFAATDSVVHFDPNDVPPEDGVSTSPTRAAGGNRTPGIVVHQHVIVNPDL